MSAAVVRRVRAEFLAILAEAVAPLDHPDMADLRVGPVHVSRHAVEITYAGAPTGPRDDPRRAYAVDRALVVEAASRTLAHRTRRLLRNGSDRVSTPDWMQSFDDAHPGWFRCELSIGPGWIDLILAMAEWLQGEGQLDGFAFDQVKQKYGSLRAYYLIGDDRTADVVDAFEALSTGICETCGAPGALRSVGGWLTTLCDTHARAGANADRDWW